jgi:hypothetical protein
MAQVEWDLVCALKGSARETTVRTDTVLGRDWGLETITMHKLAQAGGGEQEEESRQSSHGNLGMVSLVPLGP